VAKGIPSTTLGISVDGATITGAGTIANPLIATSPTPVDPGTAQGQMLFWDNGNSKWTHTET